MVVLLSVYTRKSCTKPNRGQITDARGNKDLKGKKYTQFTMKDREGKMKRSSSEIWLS